MESSRQIQKYITDISLNEDLYNAVIGYSNLEEAQQLSGYKKKYLDDTLLDYKRSGFGLPKEKRDEVKTIFNELADLGLEFSKNISDYQDTLFVTEGEINGLPENYKKERLKSPLTLTNLEIPNVRLRTTINGALPINILVLKNSFIYYSLIFQYCDL